MMSPAPDQRTAYGTTGPATRRALLRTLGLAGALPLLGACGDDPVVRTRTVGYVSSSLPRLAGTAADEAAMASAISGFTTDLFGQLSPTGNLVCSPYSVAYALAMTRNGARGETAREMDHVLHSPGLATLNAGLSRVDQAVTSRAGAVTRRDGSTARIGLDTANSLWGQADEVWKRPFLDALSNGYAAGMHQVDYRTDAVGATRQINSWTAAQTHDRIREIIPARKIDQMTRLVLVNAIWLKAPWEEPFDKGSTRPGDFLTAAGRVVTTPFMGATIEQAGYAEGDGLVAARLPYAGGSLAMAVVVPTARTGDAAAAVEERLAGGGLARLLGSFEDGMVHLVLPKWTSRSTAELSKPLMALGMPTAFTSRADFGAMTSSEQLQLTAVLHQAYVAVDEAGSEAAAATAVVARAVSAPSPLTSVRADHAFLFVIYDVPTLTPLFIGRVDDPTAG